MTTMGYAVIGILYGAVILTALFLVSGCLFDHESTSIRSAIRRIGKYLAAEPVALAFAALICSVHLLLAVTGSSERVRLEYGLPSDNAWAYIGHAFLHDNIRHLVENVGWLLVCGGLIEHKIGKGWFLVLIVLYVPLGGYLTILTAPMFIDSPWEDGLPSVGFSIVGKAIFVLCAYLVVVRTLRVAWPKQVPARARILSALREYQPQFNPLKWSARANRVATLAMFLFVFLNDINEGSPESVLGHSFGLFLGAIAVMACLVRDKFRRRGMPTTPLN